MSRRMPAIWTGPFTLTVLGTAALFVGFYVLLPVLPPYAERLGAGKGGVGLVISIYSLAAVAARLLAAGAMGGRARKALLVAGLAGFAACAAAYSLVGGVPSLLGLRVVHGLAWGLATTGFGALVADLAPASRRGEAIGAWGLAPTVAMTVGPLGGAHLLASGGFPTAFAAAALLGLLAVAVVLPVEHAAGTHPVGTRGGVHLPRGAWLPGVVLFLSNLSYGSLVAFLPVEVAGTPGRAGLFFTVFALAILVSRPFSGRLSDRLGRTAVIVPGLALGAVGTFLLGFPGSDAALAAAALLYGAGIGGAAFPVLMALTVDRCAPGERAAAVATFQTAYDLAIALGAALLGPVYARFGFLTMNSVAACAVGLSVVVLLLAKGDPRGTPHGEEGDRGQGTGNSTT